MLVPLVILAILSVIGGFMGWPEGLGGSNWFAHFLEPVVKRRRTPPPAAIHILNCFLLSLRPSSPSSAGSSPTSSTTRSPALPARTGRESPRRLLAGQKQVLGRRNLLALIVTPVLFIARWLLGVLIDRVVIDGGTLTAGASAQGLGALVARIQSGNIRSYAGWLALFAAALLAISYFGWTTHFFLR